MGTKITEDYFEFGVNKYFRGNAHLVEIGTYGEKKDPIGPKAYLDPQNIVKREHLEGRVSKGTTAEINWNQTTEAAVEVNGRMQVFGLGVSTASGFTYERAKSANLRLFNLFIVEGKLQTMLNKDANGARNYLADEGSDGRIVSEVWVVMEAELSEIIRPVAELDISEALSWYDSVVSGVGAEFIKRLYDAIDYISRNPEIHPIVYKNIRRAFIRRFPYAVYYIYKKPNIIVLAVFHFKRNPKSWLKRI